jgi:flagellar biosynthetic protein FliR
VITFDIDLLNHWLSAVIWPFVRIGSMFLAAPVIGSRSVPIRIRVILALVLSWMILPLLPPVPEIEPLSIGGMLITAQQVGIGLAMGFLMQLAFSAAVMVGQTIAMSMGLGFASVIDPGNGVQVPVVSQVFMILTTLLFLALDGHLLMIASLIQSFHSMPIGLSLWSPDMLTDVLGFTGHIFLMALLMALPVLVSVLIVNISMGIVTRAAPQLNIFAVGFPITIMVGMVVMLLSLGMFQARAITLFEDTFELLSALPG